ncbi:MAG: sigma-E factor regulatory protein RseB domain-containing protein [Bryobacteraceae bacterium]|nr:sigma-E factor regulatory protein RseB domain-containing protein [Bryobacteraceae bacterium]
MKRFGLVAVLALQSLAFAGDASSGDAMTEVIDRYMANTAQNTLRGVQMEVEFDAKLPKLKREGKLTAWRVISKVGSVRYIVDKFVGDNSVKKDVIARYMAAEQQSQTDVTPTSTAITPENYKFKYKGLKEQAGRSAHVFELNPRKKRVGLFKGELWIDSETHLPLLESGRFVKSPSIFLKKVEFVREYEIQNGRAIPKHIESHIDTRLWGRADLSINFRNLTTVADTEATPQLTSELH